MSGPPGPTQIVEPTRVHALIVGIEAYAAGGSWDLPGPARDALAFRRLLLAAGVPEGNLRLHLAPLPPFSPDVPYAGADHATLRSTLVNELPSRRGDFLWVWWGGHGVLDRAGHLRLFCADATIADKLGVDLESALERYSSDAVSGFSEQLWIVDACETFEEALAFREPLPANSLPVGHRTLTHRQTVLRAAGRGRAAVNDPLRATGLFSDILLDLLVDREAKLPALLDPEELFSAVRARLADLRAAGHTAQYPEISLQSPQRTEILPMAEQATGRSHAQQRSPLSPLKRVVDILMSYPLMADPVERQVVVSTLSPRVTATLPRHPKARTDITGIITTLTRRHPDMLRELFDAVVSLDDDPEREQELSDALRELTDSSRTS
ncbi:effector-associated domain 2-containing protein [Streptomyces phaeochromogenes]|uniref:effector-associated domain 2-containing protein n=1 Tax=Streptomyces phaeochromogenes TaxID=1923 RepID=UPI003868D3D4|nr:caspase family protein [Streptomyces phaeochromogenes]